jgi:hypothetical protein
MLSTDIRRAGGQRLPQPLRLVMHLPAGHPAGHQTSRERANHVNSRPLHPPWAATRIGIEYVGISRRDRPVFLPDFDASGRTRTWVLPMEGERHNHYATCLTSRRDMKKEVTWSARATTLQNDDQKKGLSGTQATTRRRCTSKRSPGTHQVRPRHTQEQIEHVRAIVQVYCSRHSTQVLPRSVDDDVRTL